MGRWEHFPHEADMGIRGFGATKAEAFEQAASRSTPSVMIWPSKPKALPTRRSASPAMSDAHWGYGFPIGGVAAFDPDEGGVVSAGGVGFDISSGVRCLHTGLVRDDVMRVQKVLADTLAVRIPAGLGSTGTIRLNAEQMDAMLAGGAKWAVDRGWGEAADLDRIEEHGQMKHSPLATKATDVTSPAAACATAGASSTISLTTSNARNPPFCLPASRRRAHSDAGSWMARRRCASTVASSRCVPACIR